MWKCPSRRAPWKDLRAGSVVCLVVNEHVTCHHHITSTHSRTADVCVMHAQLSLTLCDPVDWSPPGSFIHEILQARTLERIATSSSRDLPGPRFEPASSAPPALTGGFWSVLSIFCSSSLCIFCDLLVRFRRWSHSSYILPFFFVCFFLARIIQKLCLGHSVVSLLWC